MGELILAGVLTWVIVLVWWGTNLLLRPGRRDRVIGAFLFAIGLVPSVIALWVGT